MKTVATPTDRAGVIRQSTSVVAFGAGLALLGAVGQGQTWSAAVAMGMGAGALLAVLLLLSSHGPAPSPWRVGAYAAMAWVALAGVVLANVAMAGLAMAGLATAGLAQRVGEPSIPALIHAAGPVVGALLGYALLRRNRIAPAGLREWMPFASTAAVGMVLLPLSILLALAISAIDVRAPWWPMVELAELRRVWVAGALGVLATLPLLLTWPQPGAATGESGDILPDERRERRGMALLALLAAGATLWWRPDLMALGLLPLVVVAARIGPRAVAWCGLATVVAIAGLASLPTTQMDAAPESAGLIVCTALLAALAIAILSAQRDRVARELLRAQEHVRAVTERGPTLMATLDAQLQHQFANRAYLQWLRQDAAQVLGRTLQQVYGDAAGELASPVRRVFAGQAQRQQVVLADGRTLDARLEPRFSAEGPVDGVYLLAQDAGWQSMHARSMDAMLTAAFDPTVVLDGAGAIVRINDKAAALFGATREALLGQPVSAWLQAPGDATLGEALARLRDDQQSRQLGRSLELHALRAGGTAFPVELHLAAINDRRDDAGRGAQALAAVHDLGPRLAWEQLMAGSRGQAEVTLDALGDAVVACDLQGRITLFNPAAARLSGWTVDDAVGAPLDDVLRFVDADAEVPVVDPGPDQQSVIPTRVAAGLPSLARQAIRANAVVREPDDKLLLRRDGQRSAVAESAAPIRDRFGLASGAVLLLHDVSRAHAQAQNLAHQAQHDALTGLPNRVLLQDRLSQALAQMERGHKGALLYLDLDRFKPINDTYGHPVGDRVLQEVALRLRAGVREDDTVSRQGGDEFVLLLARLADPRDAARVAGKLINAIEQPILIDGHELSISASIGIALYPQDGRDTRTLTKQADAALYHAKQAGRGRYSYVADIMSASAEERMRTEHDLRIALANGDFLLAWQPQVQLPGRRISGVEALVRWRTADGGVLLPDAFIPVAEETGLVVQIDEWVLREACGQARRWQQQGLPVVPVSVNVSLARFDAERLLAHVRAVLDDTGLAPEGLEIEFKGAQLFAHGERGQALVAALKAEGVRVAADDFGSGQASLGAMAAFAFDTLKIDRDYVQSVADKPPSRAVIAAILGVGQAMGVRVIAKGVETDAQHEALVDLGCTAMQGQMFGIAASAVRFAVLVAQDAHVALDTAAEPGRA